MKSFTLVELLIVVGIVLLILNYIIFFGWDRINELNLVSEKSSFVTSFNNYVGKSISNISYNGNTYEEFSINISKLSTGLNVSFVSSGNIVKKDNYDYLNLSGVKYIPNNINFGTGIFDFESYKLGCKLKDLNNVGNYYSTGEVKIDLTSKIAKRNNCFKLNLFSCRLRKTKCN